MTRHQAGIVIARGTSYRDVVASNGVSRRKRLVDCILVGDHRTNRTEQLEWRILNEVVDVIREINLNQEVRRNGIE